MNKEIAFIALILSLITPTSAQRVIPIEASKYHYGDTVIICGRISERSFSENSKPYHMLMRLESENSRIKLTVLTNFNKGNNSDNTEINYVNKNVCIKGKIIKFKNELGIMVTNKEEIKILETRQGLERARN